MLYYLYPPLNRFLLDFSCSYNSPELDLFLVYRWRSKRNHPIRELLKVRLTIFIRHCLTELKFSIHVCIRICWFKDNRIKRSIEGTQGDVTPLKIHELSRNIIFCRNINLYNCNNYYNYVIMAIK